MAAGLAQLRHLIDNPSIYRDLNAKGERFFTALHDVARAAGRTTNHVGSLGSLFFTHGPVNNYVDAKGSDTAAFAQMFHHLLDHGVYTAPSQFEAFFVSDAHTEDDLDRVVALIADYFEHNGH
jgi:glutamate-1-semialdehyde 2,1-aminomutase